MASWEQTLDDIFSGEPSPQGWDNLCKAIGAVRKGKNLDRAIERALEGLATWPDATRLAPSRWRASLTSDRVNPRLALARAIRFEWDASTDLDGNNIRQVLAAMEPFQFTHVDFYSHSIGARGVKALAGSPVMAHIQVLNMVRCFQEGRTAMEALAASPYATRLVHLDISDTATTDVGFAHIVAAPWFPNLRTLRCRGQRSYWNPRGKGVTTASIERLVEHPTLALTELDLASNRIDDRGVQLLAECQALANLKQLTLSDNDTTVAARGYVLNSSVFTEMVYPDALIFDESPDDDPDAWEEVEEEAPLPAAELLTKLRDLLYRDADEQRWWELLELFHAFNPESPEWTVALDYAVEHVSAWPEHLRVVGADLATSMLTPTRDARLRLARTVDVPMWETISAEQLASFQRHWDELGLRGLRLSGWQVTPLREFFKRATIHGVKRLDLSGGFREGITLIRALANADWLEGLEELNLSYTNLTPRGLATIADSPVLSALSILRLENNAALGPESMEIIAERFPHLRELHAFGCGAMDLGAMHLARSRSLAGLEVLDLGQNEIGADGVAALAESEHLRNLRRLALGGNYVGDAAAQALTYSPNLWHLETLELNDAGLGTTGLQALCMGIMPALRTLKLEYNEFSGNAVANLAAASFVPSLTELELAGNSIGDKGAGAIAAAPLRALRRLNLSECEIGDDGCQALADSKDLTELYDLDLSYNNIGDKALARLIRCRSSLGRIEVWGCEVEAMTRKAIQEASNLESWLRDEYDELDEQDEWRWQERW